MFLNIMNEAAYWNQPLASSPIRGPVRKKHMGVGGLEISCGEKAPHVV